MPKKHNCDFKLVAFSKKMEQLGNMIIKGRIYQCWCGATKIEGGGSMVSPPEAPAEETPTDDG